MSEETDTPEENINKESTDKKIYYDQRSVALRTTQSVCFVEEHDKTSMLGLLLNEYKEMQVVIVVKSKKKADALSEFLISKEFNATAVHGNHREAQQKEVATKFNEGGLNIIITTDMILKTLELKNIKLVLSHDLPDDAQDYYNRLAFMKEQGVAMAFVSPEDEGLLSDIEVNMKAEIEEKTLEGFVSTEISTHTVKRKKDRKKKPRHRKSKVRKEKDA
jgi:ATP-dependent RNA helicase RhlE